MIHHALVVAQIGIGMERHQSEKDHERFAQSIGGLNGHVEGEIVEGPSRSLHPVDDTLPLRVRRRLAPYGNARIAGQFFQGPQARLKILSEISSQRRRVMEAQRAPIAL